MEALFSDYEEVRKTGLFDPEYYAKTYPDLAARNIDPLVHYLEEGAREGRNPSPDFDGAFYLEQCRQRGEQPSNPLLHYLRIGAARGFGTRRNLGARLPTGNAGGKPPILVAIESLGVVGGPDGTSRVSLSGWALAAASVVEVWPGPMSRGYIRTARRRGRAACCSPSTCPICSGAPANRC